MTVKYTAEAVSAAYGELDKRRQAAISQFNSHVEEIRSKLPEVYDIYLEITKTKDRLADVVFSKKGGVRPAVEEIKNSNLKNQQRLKEALVSLGYPEDYLTIKFCCPICSDTGIADGKRCSCSEEIMSSYTVQKLNEQCHIKLCSFSDFRLDYYPETVTYKDKSVPCRELMAQNLDFCIKYTENFSRNSLSIFMIGPTGLGKTFLSSCIAKKLIESGVSVAFDSIQNYLREIEKERFGKSEGDTLGTLLDAELLILDDLGCEFSSALNSSVIYNIINSRCNMAKPTIVSTNLKMEKLSERYDDRIISRLMGNFYPLRFMGEDIRQIKRRNGDF